MSDLTLPFRGGMDHPPSNDPVFKIVAGDAHIAVQGLSAGLETAQIDSIGVLGVSNPAGPAPGVPMINNGVGVKGICEPINFPGPGGRLVPVNPRQCIGVLGESSRGIGIFGQGGAFAGFFEGNVNVTISLTSKDLNVTDRAITESCG